jgi:hypothetical protein
MTTIRIDKSVFEVVDLLEDVVGPRKYWLHNAVGGVGWSVEPYPSYLKVKIDDPALAIWFTLKMS